jgi:aminoglycoside phosphotransferase (APT) family kinase protein
MNTPEWQADIIVTDQIAKTCIENQFSELLPIKHFQNIGEGWDNKVYLVNNKIIFRFPRRTVAIDLIHKENHLLTIIHAHVNTSLKIPYPIFQGKPSELYPYAFHGYEMILGKSACHANLTEKNRINSLEGLTEFLINLHRIDKQKAESLNISPQPVSRTDIPKVITLFEKWLQKLYDINIVSINLKLFNEVLKEAEQIKLSDNDLCVIHGDIYCRHLIFNQKKLTGIIDWGDAGIGHKAVDLSVIWSFYPAHMHKLFFKHYGQVDEDTWQYAKFMGLYSDIAILLYGIDVQDQLLVKESLDSINRINPGFLRSR